MSIITVLSFQNFIRPKLSFITAFFYIVSKPSEKIILNIVILYIKEKNLIITVPFKNLIFTLAPVFSIVIKGIYIMILTIL